MKLNALNLAILMTLFLTAGAQASSTDCTSADGKVVYNSGSPDGGPQRGPSENLTIDGKILIQNDGLLGGSRVELARVTIDPTVYWTSTPVIQGNFKVTQEVNAIKITSTADGSTEYSGFIMCQYSKYIGQPIP